MAIIGIRLIQPGEKKFNRRNIGVLSLFVEGFASVTACLLYHAKTIRDYEQAFFSWTLLCALNIGFFTTIQKSPKISQLYQIIDKMVKERKLLVILFQ